METQLYALSALYFPSLFLKQTTWDRLYDGYCRETETMKPENMATTFLTETFRFGSQLAAVLDQYVYGGQGFCGMGTEETQILVIDAPKRMGEAVTQSIREADAIKKYVKAEAIGDYVILAPYKNQCKLLEKELRLPVGKISTIHASQGKEWDTVIVSVTDANWKFFMTVWGKKTEGLKIVNTAVSRAKKKLVLVMDCAAWKHCNRELITSLAKVGSKYAD